MIMCAVCFCYRSSNNNWETYLATAQAPPPPSADSTWTRISGVTSKRCNDLPTDTSATSAEMCQQKAEESGAQYYSWARGSEAQCRHGSTCELKGNAGDWETYMHKYLTTNI